MADLPIDESVEVTIRDSTTQTQELTVNADGTAATRRNEQQLATENKVFSTNFEVSGLGITEIAVALFRNPSGSGKTAKLIRLTLVNLTSTINSLIRVRAYGGPTITADGTDLTELCTHVGQAGPASTTFSLPTASANGTRIAQWVVPAFSNALVIELDMFFILDANTQLLITAEADGVNRMLGGSLLWAEV